MQFWKKTIIVLGFSAVALGTAAAIKKPGSVYKDKPEEQNPFEGINVRFVSCASDPVNADGECGHLEADPSREVTRAAGFYERNIKRPFDLICSFFGLIILAPFFLFISIYNLSDFIKKKN